MIREMCVPTTPAIAPVRLAPDYRDFFGRAHQHSAETTNVIVNSDCYRLRIFHAPDRPAKTPGSLPWAIPNTRSNSCWVCSILGFSAQFDVQRHGRRLLCRRAPCFASNTTRCRTKLQVLPSKPVPGILFPER